LLLQGRTEHPRLVIVPRHTTEYVFTKKSLTRGNTDLFTYVNSKFVYLERHIKTQIVNLHHEIMLQKCQVQKELFETQLAVGLNHPEDFARLFMKKEGYTAVRAGEVVHIIQCQAVEVNYKPNLEQCYDEFPVTYNNKTMFMMPNTRILKHIGTPISCTDILSPMYILRGKWYSVSNRLVETKDPEELDPDSVSQWKYESIGNMLKDGLYGYDVIETMNKMILFQLDSRGINQVIAYNANYGSLAKSNQGLYLDGMITEEKIISTFTTWWKSGSSMFMTFGTIYAGFLGVYWVLKTIKWIFDTYFLGSILYDIYRGC
jgi:hypothetical protein